jgi:lipopolysaccharide biosynthesis glycosyltransferase
MEGAAKRTCVVFAISGRSQEYLDNGTVIAVSSVRISNPDLPLVILHSDLNSRQQQMFDMCDVRRVDPGPFERSERARMERPDLDSSVFLRFAMGEITDYDVAIYLDSDLVVLDSLQPMLDLDGALMCRDMASYALADQFVDGSQLLASEGLAEDLKPVNAGVMRVDLRFWREIMPRIAACVNRHGWNAFAYCDQSLINLVGHTSGHLRYLPAIYNYMMWPDMQERVSPLSRNVRGLVAPEIDGDHARVVHWTGPVKPWHEAFKQATDEERLRFCGPCYQQFRDSHSS